MPTIAARHLGHVDEKGVLVLADPPAWRAAVARHRGRDVFVTVSRRQNARTLSQNSLYWVWCSELGNYIGEPRQAIHELLKERFLPKREIELLEGQRMEMPASTRTLSVEEFSQYMRDIQTWAATFLGLALPEAGALEAVL